MKFKVGSIYHFSDDLMFVVVAAQGQTLTVRYLNLQLNFLTDDVDTIHVKPEHEYKYTLLWNKQETKQS